MLGHTFYHQSLRKYVILFGTVFNDLHILRRDSNDNVFQEIKVPLTYAPREKVTARLEQNLNLDNKESVLLPRMSFEMTGMQYAPERKLNTLNRYTKVDQNDPNKKFNSYNPVPYDLLFDLNIYTRYAEDATAVLEQILPFFTPEWTGTINLIPELDTKVDVPIVLQGLSSQDTYEGDFETRRALIWSLQFVMKGYLFGPIRSSGVIKKANTRFFTSNTSGGWATDPVVAAKITPGLDQFRQPTSNSQITIAVDEIKADDDYGLIVDFEDFFNDQS